MVRPAHTGAAAFDDSTLVPGSLQRVRQIAALREQGRSLDEIALRFGVSRERVRQILRAHGGPDPQDVGEARRRRVEQQTEARIDELLALWRAGEDLGSAASALGLQATACRSAITSFATEIDRAARKASLASSRAMAKTYSDRDIIVALTSVATRLGRVPTAKEYGVLARELECPSLATVLNRMSGWTNAVRAAGLTPASTPARTRSRRWTVEACWAALRHVVAELGEIPTVVGYDRHAADRTDLPSSATVRNRLGRWSAITSQLADERKLAGDAQGARTQRR
ncbi:MAG: homing endonuclease associated repeat-containing protein [Solirubrobacteraceae bacterium]